MNARAKDLPLTHGPLVQPGEHDYDAEKTGYNLSVEHHPTLIVGATDASDVVAAVGFARDRALPVAVQATGHGVSVPADEAVFINTRRMTGIRVDPASTTARIEAGVKSGQLVREAASHGLAPLNGSAPEVGAVSYMLGGGVSILGRQFGYAADYVRELDVVTADGRLRQVSAQTDPDLFWALRGGKGNFGVVVSMEIDLVPVTRLYGGGMFFPAESTPDLLHTYRTWVDDVPEEMGSSVLLIQLPDMPGVPEPLRGRYVSHVRIAYTGTVEEGERWVRPLRDVGARLIDTVEDMPYSDVGSIHNEPTAPVAFYAKNTMLRTLDPDTIDTLLALARPDARAPYLVELRLLGGAFSRPPHVPNAIGRRDAKFCVYSGSQFLPEQLDTVQAAQEALHRGLAPWGTGGVCLNFLTGPDVSTEELRSAYLPADFTRLAELKKRYDPNNLFRINHNIPTA